MKFFKLVLINYIWLLALFSTVCAADGLKFVETADSKKSKETRELVQWTHSRLVFNKPLERIAVGQEETLQVEVLSKNEALALAKKVGRTSVMVWYTDNTSETFLFTVTSDLSVLHHAIKDIHPNISLTLAPDRNALVLRGKVPTIKYRIAAEAAARNYFEAGQGDNDNVLLQSSAIASLVNNLRMQDKDVQHTLKRKTKSAAIINLIKVEILPEDIVTRVKNNINLVGGESVTVTRVQHGDVPNANQDTLLLKGYVDNQVELVRVLTVASRLVTGEESKKSKEAIITILANESGGLFTSNSKKSSAGPAGLGISGASGSSGSSDNNLASNIGRAKLLSIAGGKLLSVIEVRDLPLIRVSVQMYEVNHRRLKQWRPDFSVLSKGYDKTSGNFGLAGASPNESSSTKVNNALQVLGGGLVNNLQVAGKDFAFDLLFSMLEEEGISKTLSRPTLTVLAGESAVFSAGGEVPVPTAFAPSGIVSGDEVGANTSGVFSGTTFKSFGVQLQVRAMVDEHDRITLDLNPTISTPDTLLTQEISSSTGSGLNTSAFNVRSISTSTRLRDGQPMVIGGLVSRDINNNRDFIPGASRVPVLGKLAESTSDSDTERELFIIVTPTIVREMKHEVNLWQFPSTEFLLQKSVFNVNQAFNASEKETVK
ncbi:MULTISPECIES: pilus assembly protein N-terminal domain-containing protein [unclassified Colwellia]|uniref:pilus assembly protein N-terminal domain-containing protein n=1 Tax=unclassified Colwellia TaxID=196834 RepID=UPI0015F4213E|nr:MULTISPECIES: pilus assembly protein N-terminal domain-containing protein [unclassified Colwellia]MBA6364450.1 pilus assembly protein N-terminal domain-containing protein [Colwellia sp. BRX8-8]MBA6352518.1 pilus assembly protein N-terminal domain-containing protein [Colwellia sp. BRX9-1]MBA6356503.1 pilus assembly protein N-terminal domain-containing protein [Colwellia sp. BRX8-3]MBA6361757.1 pilus assembly protein N-terminal domain-containing protein [Colwellia sp. BRX8-6]MBA6367593.1 pilu